MKDHIKRAHDALNRLDLSERAAAAIKAALVTRGVNAGQLLKRCPPMNADAAVAWQTLMMEANPYKVSICQLILMNEDKLLLRREIERAIEGVPEVKLLDGDRVALMQMRAW